MSKCSTPQIEFANIKFETEVLPNLFSEASRRQQAQVEVDTTSNVYVADGGNKRVLKLAAGSNTPTVLPFTGLKGPGSVTVDTTGNVYVSDSGTDQVVKLAAG